jgi:hypothetical protein
MFAVIWNWNEWVHIVDAIYGIPQMTGISDACLGQEHILDRQNNRTKYNVIN